MFSRNETPFDRPQPTEGLMCPQGYERLRGRARYNEENGVPEKKAGGWFRRWGSIPSFLSSIVRADSGFFRIAEPQPGTKPPRNRGKAHGGISWYLIQVLLHSRNVPGRREIK
jgi:hypothetical protein